MPANPRVLLKQNSQIKKQTTLWTRSRKNVRKKKMVPCQLPYKNRISFGDLLMQTSHSAMITLELIFCTYHGVTCVFLVYFARVVFKHALYAEDESNTRMPVGKKVVDKKPGKEKEAPSTAGKKITELESMLEKQSKDLWEIKDKLRAHVSTAEMRDMLTANEQDATGSEYDLRERWLVHLTCHGF